MSKSDTRHDCKARKILQAKGDTGMLVYRPGWWRLVVPGDREYPVAFCPYCGDKLPSR